MNNMLTIIFCLVSPWYSTFLNTLQPFDTEDENKISNYLYERSREIEPKNCKKPPVKDRKWPNNYLKSPGIKIRNKAMPNPLPPRPHPCPNEGGGHLSKGMLEGDEVSVSGMAGISGGGSERGTPTPTSPNTPIILPAIQQTQQLYQDQQQQQQHSATADTAIFCPVEIGAFNVGSTLAEPRNSISFPSAASLLSSTSSPQAPPPPLPPRRKREPSVGDTSPKVKQAPDAPELPPRDVSPPPIPPRINTNTLPPPHHRPPPPTFLTAPVPPPPPLQPHYPPQDSPHHRRNNSVDLTSPTPLARRHTNGPHTVLATSVVSDGGVGGGGDDSVDHPPTPPPRLSYRHAFTFTYDQHHS
ncbi:hypothetical protein Pmani_016051 [Petrolisthes manimaculis]|uniref:Uncharacterized protein n=1 Tax=Petrolisthes manimaculis TaxID=1843537 RepID=A0AAE1PPU0_9EUCA|nr:hypothetical protein Pmani_016051 [Petrolisthes manimaculis]